MKTLRLIITEQCDRECEGCCNKQFDVKSLPKCESFDDYDQIILTGGEPLLNPSRVIEIMNEIRIANPLAYIIVYTAKTDDHRGLAFVAKHADAMTVTLHEHMDAVQLMSFAISLPHLFDGSFRMNVFKSVKLMDQTYTAFEEIGWKVKKDIEWIEDCPLPENETLMRL